MPTALRLHPLHPQRSRAARFRPRLQAIAAAASAITLSLTAPAFAADPFRATNPRPIDDQTEAAFRAIFEQGDYRTAAQLLESPNPSEPLGFAIRASLAYIDQDWDTLGDNATRTREVAEQLVATDPLRGHLYTAVGHFLEGAHTLSTQETIRATPTILSKLQQVFDNLNRAEAIDPNDPELNLLKGYMDLMLAVNLPFSSPEQAIARLQTYAAPAYLAQRGIAVGYRDLNQHEQAIAAVDRALQETPDNPDLLYLKAQILALQSRHQESLAYFQQALAKRAQLPRNLVAQISFEECRAANRVNNRTRNCDAVRDRLRSASANP